MKGPALSQLPPRFQSQPRSETLESYISAKYSKHGFAKGKAIEFNPESTDNHYRWIENITDGLRFVGKADEVVRLRHTGWFVDDFQDQTVHGEVYQLPARDGECQFVPAVNDPNNDDSACVDFTAVTTDKEDAAWAADSMAERWAKREREYQAEESRKIRLEEIEDEIKTEYANFRRMARELRFNCDKVAGVGVVRELVRKEWQRTKGTIHKLRAERERVTEYGIERY